MECEVVYPIVKKYSRSHMIFISICRYLFIVAAIACVTVNIITGMPAWSAPSVLGMWWVYRQFINPKLVGYNRINQFVIATAYLAILLIVIVFSFELEWHIWLNFVLPLVILPALVVLAFLLFTDFRKQKHNLMPLINFDFLCVIGSTVGLCVQGPEWPILALLGTSALLFIVAILTMRLSIWQEFKKYFSIK